MLLRILGQRLLSVSLLVSLLVFSGVPAWAKADAELDKQLGQMILVGFRGLTVPPNSAIGKDIAAGRVGGVILFDYDVVLREGGRNIINSTQVTGLIKSMQKLAPTPLFIAVDQEGGRVARFRSGNGFIDFPSAEEMGKNTVEATKFVGQSMGKMLAELGVNINFAPVVDVNDNPKSPAIGAVGRSFSASSATVTSRARAFLDGLQAGNKVLGCIKHFPGHGSAGADSHMGVADVSATWKDSSLAPYAALIKEKRVQLVMTGHLFNSTIDPDHPATLSHATLTGILRNKLGFEGVIFSDDMQMRAITEQYELEKAVELAVLAGVDVLSFGNNLIYDPEIAIKAHAILKKLVAEGRISRERVAESAERIGKVKASLR